MTTIELLEQCQIALNHIRNTRLPGKFKDSYELASAVDKHLQENKPTETKKFFCIDKSGRGYSGNILLTDLLNGEDESSYYGEQLHEWATDADAGDKWENATSEYTCIS